MLHLYTYGQFLNEKYRKRVHPLLFEIHFLKSKSLQKHYALTQLLEDADVAIFPIDVCFTIQQGQKNLLENFINRAKAFKKTVWVYSSGDYGYTLKDPEIFNFRLGGFHTKLNERAIIMPSFINDPLEHTPNKKFIALPKNEIPEVGFVGHADKGFGKLFDELLIFCLVRIRKVLKMQIYDAQPFFPPGFMRGKYLDMLSKSTLIKANFILRKNQKSPKNTLEELRNLQTDFFNSIYNNSYTFCMRGEGNFSVRFYETLAMGRIPVLINTNCRLPLHKMVDWEKHCFIIDKAEVEKLPEKLSEFHKSLTREDFTNMQLRNRKLWEEKLCRDSYFETISKVFEDEFLKKRQS